MQRTAIAASFAVPLLLITGLAAAQTYDDCAALRGFALAGVALEITAAMHVAEGPVALPPVPGFPGYSGLLPAHCRVDGVIDRRIGVNDVPYGIKFALALPEDWNGRFLFQGGGGLNGAVRPPFGAGASGDTPALARGYAVVTTDSGHEGAGFDGSFFADQEATLNFLYAANGKVTTVAKAIIAAHYARGPDHSYFVGCSTGGREGMIMSQRYPTFFDGIVSGAPAMRTGYSNLGMRSVAVALASAADRNAQDNVVPGTALSGSDKALIVSAFVTRCDALDGLADGMIFNTQACDFDPAALTCSGAKNDQCLTAVQVGAVKRAMAGAKASNGDPVYASYLYDTGIAASGPGIPGLLNGAPSPVDGPTPPRTQNVDAEAIGAALEPSALGNTHAWTNLSTFSGRGGKLLFYHGVSDPWFSAVDTLEYYGRLTEASGGMESVRDFSRLFLVPGMGHCGGGAAALDRFDLLSAVVAWVEDGAPPDAITATGNAFPGRSRPLCAYPEYAHFVGEANPKDAANFECR
jgi:feruloyl esterase